MKPRRAIGDPNRIDNARNLDVNQLPQQMEVKAPKNQAESLDFSNNVEFSVSNGITIRGNSLNKGISLNITPQKIPVDLTSQKTAVKSNEMQPSYKSSPLNEMKVVYDPASLLKMIKASGPITHLFRIWPGNNRFYFSGSLMTGPPTDKVSNYFTWSGIIIVNVVFYSVAAPFLWNYVNPFFPILSGYLLLMTIGFLLLTSYSDPGIIPRRSILLATRGKVPEKYSSKAVRVTETLQTRAPLSRNGSKITSRYCKICQIYRPLRTQHCKECNNCVELRDTHSSFVNNCVGKRNYKYYILFLISLVSMGLCELAGFIMAGVLYFTSYDGLNHREMNGSTVVVVVFSILTIPALMLTFVAGIFLSYFLKQFSKKREGITSEVGRSPPDRTSLFSTWCKFDTPLFNPKQPLTLEELTIFQDQKLSGEDSESPLHNERTSVEREKIPPKNKSPQLKSFSRNSINFT